MQKGWLAISTYLLIICTFCFTIGQFVPIYFVNSHSRDKFYISLLIILVTTLFYKVFTIVHSTNKRSVFVATIISLLTGFLAFIVVGLWTLLLLMSVWSEARTYYVKKSNPDVKIISRYVNLGATGGGTEPEDYHIVLHRPLLYFFKIETSIDTTLISKSDWTRVAVTNSR